MKKIVLLLAALLLTIALSQAQEQKQEQAPAMPRPKFGPELAKLSFLVGDFTTETAIQPNPMMPNGSTGKGRSTLKWGLDSMFLIIEETSQSALLGNYKGQGLLTYDRQEKQYVLSMFNNFGDHPVYKGDFNGDTLVLETDVPIPGGSFKQKLMWYRDKKNVRLQIMNNMGTGFMPVIEQTYTPAAEYPQQKPKK